MRRRALLALWAVSFIVVAGCSGGDEAVPVLASDSSNGLDGLWYYEITNAYNARFTDCSGDATVLEGLTFNQGVLVAPICLAPNWFDAVQDGAAVELLPATGRCGTEPATFAGIGDIEGDLLVGELQFRSDDGVTATHPFSGVASGDVLLLSEHTRTFDGAFQGTCSLTPPLGATVTVR